MTALPDPSRPTQGVGHHTGVVGTSLEAVAEWFRDLAVAVEGAEVVHGHHRESHHRVHYGHHLGCVDEGRLHERGQRLAPGKKLE